LLNLTSENAAIYHPQRQEAAKNEIPVILGFSLLVALALPSGQALKAALAVPVKSLRCE
jgi:hypothetical protein